MKWYWAIDCDNTVETPYISSKGDLKNVENWHLRRGQAIDNWDSSAWIRSKSRKNDGDPDDVLQSHIDLPLYSDRLRRALDKAGIGGIQYLDIHVLRSDGTEIPGFAIANVLNKVYALDYEHSEYSLFPADYFIEEQRGTVRGIRRAVLLASVLNGYHIIRLEEFTPSLYVSEHFKHTFEDGGFTGYSFSEVRLT